jgi:hypothetical protein
MNIGLTIDQLILDGLDLLPHHRPHLQAAVEAELSRLLTTNGLGASLQGGGAIPTLAAGSIQVEAGHDPTALGQQIARAVYGGLSR